MIAGDQNDRRIGELVAQPLEFPKGEQDRRVAGPHGMKQVAGHDDRVRARGDHPVDRQAEGGGHIRLPLVDPVRGLAMILAEAQVGIS